MDTEILNRIIGIKAGLNKHVNTSTENNLSHLFLEEKLFL